MTDSQTATRKIPISGREITVRQLTDGQLTLIMREARVIQRDTVETERRMVGAARLFDIMESMVVTEEDREFVLDEIVAGKVELRDLLAGLKAFSEEEKPKVRRGRPPKRI